MLNSVAHASASTGSIAFAPSASFSSHAFVSSAVVPVSAVRSSALSDSAPRSPCHAVTVSVPGALNVTAVANARILSGIVLLSPNTDLRSSAFFSAFNTDFHLDPAPLFSSFAALATLFMFSLIDASSVRPGSPSARAPMSVTHASGFVGSIPFAPEAIPSSHFCVSATLCPVNALKAPALSFRMVSRLFHALTFSSAGASPLIVRARSQMLSSAASMSLSNVVLMTPALPNASMSRSHRDPAPTFRLLAESATSFRFLAATPP